MTVNSATPVSLEPLRRIRSSSLVNCQPARAAPVPSWLRWDRGLLEQATAEKAKEWRENAVYLTVNVVDSVSQMLSRGPARFYEGLQNLTESALAFLAVLKQPALIREVAAYNPQDNILR